MAIARQAVQRHRAENSKQIFPEIKLCGSVPNSYIHVSVIELYIPTICLPICCSKIGGSVVGKYKSLTNTVPRVR